MVCGYSLSYLRFAKPRGFKGDFYAAMYDPNWWDGQGIIYGPIFVFERWFVNSSPDFASIEFFALTGLVLIILGLLITIRTVQARGSLLVFCGVVWSLNTFFYYSFSVASNPEILELFFLLTMWWSLTNKHYNLAYFLFTCAVLTKLAPAILAPVLLLFFSWSGLAISLFMTVFVYTIVSIGQNQSLLQSLKQTLAVNPVDPAPTSEQFLGINSALSRLFGLTSSSNFQVVETISLLILFTFYSCAIVVLVRFLRLQSDFEHKNIVTYFFALFMTLLPMMHLGQAHRHTFLFLAPVFVAMKYLVKQDSNLNQRRKYNNAMSIIFIGYSFLPIYALDYFNFDDLNGRTFLGELHSSFVMVTEPIWINIILFLVILNYGNRMLNLRKKHRKILEFKAQN